MSIKRFFYPAAAAAMTFLEPAAAQQPLNQIITRDKEMTVVVPRSTVTNSQGVRTQPNGQPIKGYDVSLMAGTDAALQITDGGKIPSLDPFLNIKMPDGVTVSPIAFYDAGKAPVEKDGKLVNGTLPDRSNNKLDATQADPKKVPTIAIKNEVHGEPYLILNGESRLDIPNLRRNYLDRDSAYTLITVMQLPDGAEPKGSEYNSIFQVGDSNLGKVKLLQNARDLNEFFTKSNGIGMNSKLAVKAGPQSVFYVERAEAGQGGQPEDVDGHVDVFMGLEQIASFKGRTAEVADAEPTYFGIIGADQSREKAAGTRGAKADLRFIILYPKKLDNQAIMSISRVVLERINGVTPPQTRVGTIYDPSVIPLYGAPYAAVCDKDEACIFPTELENVENCAALAPGTDADKYLCGQFKVPAMVLGALRPGDKSITVQPVITTYGTPGMFGLEPQPIRNAAVPEITLTQ